MAGVRISIPLRGTSESANPLEREHEALAKISITEVHLPWTIEVASRMGPSRFAARPTNSR